MRLGHYQCVCRAGDFERNLDTVCQGLALAAERRLAICSFPEAFLGGYWLSESDARANAWPLDSPQTRELLARTRAFPAMLLVGFNERRGDDLYDTVLVAERGELVGHYSKAWPAMPYFTPSRATPVFRKDELTFGIVICADGGYIEPTRILALKGARVIFAPHYNYIGPQTLLDHYVHVRADHVARAVENQVYFIRGNNVEREPPPSLPYPGVGYGDSYILDPNGQVVVAANLHAETLIDAEVDLQRPYYGGQDKSLQAAREYWAQLRELTIP